MIVEGKRRRFRAGAIALGASLAINAVLIGFGVARLLDFRRAFNPVDEIERHFSWPLDRDDASRVRSTVESRRTELEAANDAARRAIAAVGEALGRDPLDRAALNAAVRESLAKRATFETAIADTMTSAMVELSDDGRRRLADRLKHAPMMRPPHDRP